MIKLSEENKPLAAIVCGFPRGGTTLLSEILRTHPKLDSGFEGGFLLVDKISDFLELEPYNKQLKTGWKISEKQLINICETDDYIEVYRRLVQYSLIIEQKDTWIFDKTPKYMQFLPSVLTKVPNVPCIVIVRDPRAVIWSWVKRTNLSVEEWQKKRLENNCAKYMAFVRGYKKAIRQGFGERILLVKYEELCLNKKEESKKIFEFIGMDWEVEQLSLNKKYPNVYGNDVSDKYLTEYKENFSPEICEKILNLTKPAKEWLWEGNK